MMHDWPPLLSTDPIQLDIPLARLIRQLLAEVGGVASARHLRDALVHLRQQPLTIRQTRDLLKSPKVRNLGAGYFSLTPSVFEPVRHWVERRLSTTPAMSVHALTLAIQDHYPRGDCLAIQYWLQQEPGRIQLSGDVVQLTPQQWRRR